jgi:hypothetical protein
MPDKQVVTSLTVALTRLLDQQCGIWRLGAHGNVALQDLMCEAGRKGFRSAEFS